MQKLQEPFLKGITFPFNQHTKKVLSSQLIYTSRNVHNNDRQHKGLDVPPYVGLQYLKKSTCFWQGYGDACQLDVSPPCEHHIIKDDISSTSSINNRTQCLPFEPLVTASEEIVTL